VIWPFAPETNGGWPTAPTNLESGSASPFANCGRGPQLQDHLGRDHPENHAASSAPVWSGLVIDGRPGYRPLHPQLEYGVPWRTLSGRHRPLSDHPYYGEFHEGLPTFKGKIPPGPGRDGRGDRPRAHLPDPPRQVEHPFHLQRQSPGCSRLPRGRWYG